MKRAILKPREERRIQRGHLWVYRNELETIPPLEDGDVADVYTHDGKFLARCFYQAEGGIAFRVLDYAQVDIDATFLAGRISRARGLRETLFPGSSVYRWTHGESDGLPGLVVDRYASVVHVHTSCAFYARHADVLVDAFMSGGDVTGVSLQFSGRREPRGTMPRQLRCDFGGIEVEIDLEKSQKTGLFLDQRLNRQWLRELAPNKRVLDCHAYVGAWSIEAAKAGAAQVTAVDSSAPAIERARHNAELNGVLERCSFETKDVSAKLQEDALYDIVILDPPALAKTRASAEKALGLYQSLNRDAMKRITPGGYLITSSCSHFVDREAFMEMLKRASRAAHRPLTLLALAGASPDHPVSLAMPETEYLKCAIARVD